MKLISYLLFIQFFLIKLSFGQLEETIHQFVSFPEFKNAGISIHIVDCESGEVKGEYLSNMALIPASTTKLFSTAGAISILGPNYRPSTSIYLDGDIDSLGNLKGNIWVKGEGDMTLGSKYFNENQQTFLNNWVNELKNYGINSIQGDIIIDGSSFGYEGAPDGWNWSDLGNYYGSAFSGITVFDNMLVYTFKTKSAGTTSELISIYPEIKGLTFQNYILSENVRGDNSYIYGAPYSFDRFGVGSLPMNKNSFEVKGSIPDPEMAIGQLLFDQLINDGISVSGTFVTKRKSTLKSNYTNFKLIKRFDGESVASIAKLTNHKSINLFAEGLLDHIGYIQTKDGSTSNSVDYLTEYYSKYFNTSGLYLKDGSGLSRTNAIAASHFTGLLRHMYNSKYFKAFYETLPISGVSGTLKSVCVNQFASGKIHAKSGTMSRVKSYAGYIESISGKTYAFAIIVNNYNCSNSTTVDQMEKIFNAIARL